MLQIRIVSGIVVADINIVRVVMVRATVDVRVVVWMTVLSYSPLRITSIHWGTRNVCLIGADVGAVRVIVCRSIRMGPRVTVICVMVVSAVGIVVPRHSRMGNCMVGVTCKCTMGSTRMSGLTCVYTMIGAIHIVRIRHVAVAMIEAEAGRSAVIASVCRWCIRGRNIIIFPITTLVVLGVIPRVELVAVIETETRSCTVVATVCWRAVCRRSTVSARTTMVKIAVIARIELVSDIG